MHAEHGLDRELVEQPLLHHDASAALVLLGGLEDEMHDAVEIARLGEIFGGAEQHGRVAVMAAGVHLAGVPVRRGRSRSSRGCAARPCRRAGRSRGPRARDLSVPTTPVPARPRCTSMPNSDSFFATCSAVRCSSNAVSGWACRSRRHAVISSWKAEMRLTIGMAQSLARRWMRLDVSQRLPPRAWTPA